MKRSGRGRGVQKFYLLPASRTAHTPHSLTMLSLTSAPALARPTATRRACSVRVAASAGEAAPLQPSRRALLAGACVF